MKGAHSMKSTASTTFEADPAHDFSPTYADTRAWFDRLDAASDLIRIEQFGVSPEGRPIYAVIASKDGDAVKAGQTVANWDPHNHPIVSEVAGFVRFVDFVDGITVIENAAREPSVRFDILPGARYSFGRINLGALPALPEPDVTRLTAAFGPEFDLWAARTRRWFGRR